MKVVILAAGMGSRLGDKTLPKPLTPLCNGHSILSFQLHCISQFLPLDHVLLVVGFSKEKIIHQFPSLSTVHNPNYAKENTSKSLLKAIQNLNEDVLWINGDVVFHPSVFKSLLDFNKTAMVVNTSPVSDEEVKYQTNNEGKITLVSKEVPHPQGEALGINLVKAHDLPLLKNELTTCNNHDYFEKAIENAIKKGLNIQALPIPPNLCTEIDFPNDLTRANNMIQEWGSAPNPGKGAYPFANPQ